MNFKSKYNSYDNPSSSMRLNCSQLKNVMLVTEYVIKNEQTPTYIKQYARDLYNRTDRYCQTHFTKVYEELENIKNTTLERYFN
jgi:recombinational DNA repair protein RecR